MGLKMYGGGGKEEHLPVGILGGKKQGSREKNNTVDP